MSFSMILEGTTQTFFLMNSLSSRTVFQDTRQWINILDLTFSPERSRSGLCGDMSLSWRGGSGHAVAYGQPGHD